MSDYGGRSRESLGEVVAAPPSPSGVAEAWAADIPSLRRRRGIGAVATVAGCLAAATIVLGLIGPWLAPHSVGDLIGAPFSPPSGKSLLGTDYLGRDVLSRVLGGGRGLILVAIAGTIAATVVGATVGLAAGFFGGKVDSAVMRLSDVLLVLPSVLVLLVLATIYRGGALVLIAVVVLTHSPLLARVTRASTLEVVHRPFVEAAVARGESVTYTVFREILPNVRSSALAMSGLIFVGAVYISAAAGFLGISDAPPAADWGRMIQENFDGAQAQPWSVVVPAILLVALAASMNIFADGVQRRFGSH